LISLSFEMIHDAICLLPMWKILYNSDGINVIEITWLEKMGSTNGFLSHLKSKSTQLEARVGQFWFPTLGKDKIYSFRPRVSLHFKHLLQSNFISSKRPFNFISTVGVNIRPVFIHSLIKIALGKRKSTVGIFSQIIKNDVLLQISLVGKY